mgnify:CR=1 FL=1
MSQYTDKAKQHMDKCLEALQANFSRVRTGRANPHILDPIKVDYYGQPVRNSFHASSYKENSLQ